MRTKKCSKNQGPALRFKTHAKFVRYVLLFCYIRRPIVQANRQSVPFTTKLTFTVTMRTKKCSKNQGPALRFRRHAKFVSTCYCFAHISRPLNSCINSFHTILTSAFTVMMRTQKYTKNQGPALRFKRHAEIVGTCYFFAHIRRTQRRVRARVTLLRPE